MNCAHGIPWIDCESCEIDFAMSVADGSYRTGVVHFCLERNDLAVCGEYPSCACVQARTGESR